MRRHSDELPEVHPTLESTCAGGWKDVPTCIELDSDQLGCCSGKVQLLLFVSCLGARPWLKAEGAGDAR